MTFPCIATALDIELSGHSGESPRHRSGKYSGNDGGLVRGGLRREAEDSLILSLLRRESRRQRCCCCCLC